MTATTQDVPPNLIATFLDEAEEHLQALERGLMEIEDRPDDRDLMNRVFRAAHSIKGGSGVFGLEPVVRLTHLLETLLAQLKRGELPVTRERIDLLLRSSDVLAQQFRALRAGHDPAHAPAELLEGLRHESGPPGHAAASPPKPTSTPPAAAQPARTGVYRVALEPGPRLLLDGTDPLILLRNLSRRGELLSVRADLGRLPALGEIEPTHAYLGWEVRLRVDDPAEIEGVFEFVRDCCELTIRPDAATLEESMPAVLRTLERLAEGLERLAAMPV